MSLIEFCASLRERHRIGNADIKDDADIPSLAIGPFNRSVELRIANAQLEGGLVTADLESYSSLTIPEADAGDIAFWSFHLPEFYDVTESLVIEVGFGLNSSNAAPTPTTRELNIHVSVANAASGGSASPAFVDKIFTLDVSQQDVLFFVPVTFETTDIAFLADDIVAVKLFRAVGDDLAQPIFVTHVRALYVSKNG